MVYQLYYKQRKNILFDIEFYKTIDDFHKSEDDKWYLDLHCHSFISGAVEFIQDNINSSNIEEFKKDCEQIEDLRMLIWENTDNSSCSIDKCTERYKTKLNEINSIITVFANKWNLIINID